MAPISAAYAAPVEISCRNGHRFKTKARGGQTIACPVCRIEGEGRVQVRVPKHIRDRSTPAPDDDGELAAAWAAEASQPVPESPAADGETCPECGGSMMWRDRARTTVYCPVCNAVDVPRDVTEVADRQAARSRELAVRESAPVVVDHALALEIAADRERLRGAAARAAAEVDPAGLGGYAAELAFGYVGQFRWIADQAARATTREDLTTVRDILNRVMSNCDQQRNVIDAARVYAGQLAPATAERDRRGMVVADARRLDLAPADDDDDDGTDYDDELPCAYCRATCDEYCDCGCHGDDDDDGADYAPRQTGGVLVLAGMAASMAIEYRNAQKAKAARLERNGPCEFRHFGSPPVAEWRYGGGMPDQYMRGGDTFHPTGPSVRCCPRHRADAERNIRAQGWASVVYEPLS